MWKNFSESSGCGDIRPNRKSKQNTTKNQNRKKNIHRSPVLKRKYKDKRLHESPQKIEFMKSWIKDEHLSDEWVSWI